MFDKKYYQDRQKKLEDKFLVLKDKLITNLVNLINEFSQNRQELANDFNDLQAQIDESKKGQNVPPPDPTSETPVSKKPKV